MNETTTAPVAAALAAALWVVLALPACFGGDGPRDPPSSQGHVPSGDGTLFVDWTVGGQAPSTGSCKGVDHLVVRLFGDRGDSVAIEPVTCTLDRFRYDHLPEGGAVIRLDALDASGCRVATAQARITLTRTPPAAPTATIPLPAPIACR